MPLAVCDDCEHFFVLPAEPDAGCCCPACRSPMRLAALAEASHSHVIDLRPRLAFRPQVAVEIRLRDPAIRWARGFDARASGARMLK